MAILPSSPSTGMSCCCRNNIKKQVCVHRQCTNMEQVALDSRPSIAAPSVSAMPLPVKCAISDVESGDEMEAEEELEKNAEFCVDATK